MADPRSAPARDADPRFGEPPSEPTEVPIAYDDAYLYVAGHLYAAPEHVFAASFKRDLFTVRCPK